MANDVWSEADIKTRLHTEIRSVISEQAETELNRALQGAIMKMHVLTASEQKMLMGFKAATDRVAALGATARADSVLLTKTLAHEKAAKRLNEPPYILSNTEPDVFGEVSLQALDDQERNAALLVVTAATQDVLELVGLRYEQNNPTTPD